MHPKTAADNLAETTADRIDEIAAGTSGGGATEGPADGAAGWPAGPAAEGLVKTVPGRSSGFKALYLKLERMLDHIERIEESTALLETVLRVLVRDFRDDLGFQMGRLYRREGSDYELCCAFGGTWPLPIGYRVPREHPPHVRTLAEGLLIMRPGDPGYDEQLVPAIGPDATFAAIAVGHGSTHVLVFSVDGEVNEEHVLYSLSAIRHVINMKLQQGRLVGFIEEARIIQESLLPTGDPQVAGYEVHGYSRPAEIVGGDIYDYLPRRDRLLGVAVGDACGHGLPAALLARDVITGLRMGMNETSKVPLIVERLNRVIHRAVLLNKFISLFYGEFGPGGTLVYCNAGHNPPLHQRGTALRPLERGGLILGVNPAARYVQGRACLQRGDLVVLYTDGLIERENPRGEQYGLARLKRLLRDLPRAGVRERVEAIFADGDRHAAGAAVQDDMTVVVVRRM
jgi:sigma-B regulation protein RsbU (phosphoserine phosphatase)